MNKENSDRLFNEFPVLYALRHSKYEPIARGVEVGDGWFKPVYKMSKALEAHNRKILGDRGYRPKDLLKMIKENSSIVMVLQLKSKFAGLRCYHSCPDVEVNAIVEDAEDECAGLCERCGEPGTLRNDGWLSIQCGRCHDEYLKRRKG